MAIEVKIKEGLMNSNIYSSIEIKRQMYSYHRFFPIGSMTDNEVE